jgi:hypothetical protein
MGRVFGCYSMSMVHGNVLIQTAPTLYFQNNLCLLSTCSLCWFFFSVVLQNVPLQPLLPFHRQLWKHNVSLSVSWRSSALWEVNLILNNFWSTESYFNQFSEFLKTLNALCICLKYKHPWSMKRVIRSDKQISFPCQVEKMRLWR